MANRRTRSQIKDKEEDKKDCAKTADECEREAKRLRRLANELQVTLDTLNAELERNMDREKHFWQLHKADVKRKEEAATHIIQQRRIEQGLPAKKFDPWFDNVEKVD